jgi:hypothetical protein
MYEKIDVLDPTSPDLCVHPPGAVCRQLRVLTESADQLIERFILRFCLARLTTGLGLPWLGVQDPVKWSSGRKSGKQ